MTVETLRGDGSVMAFASTFVMVIQPKTVTPMDHATPERLPARSRQYAGQSEMDTENQVPPVTDIA